VPTFAWLRRLRADFDALLPDQQAVFLAVIADFVADLQNRTGFCSSLRVKGVKGASGVFEMTWAADGRATLQYGAEVTPNEPHIVWRRVGTHQIFRVP
jgi:hypothetical protein